MVLAVFSLIFLLSPIFLSAPAGAQSLKVGMTSKTLFYLPFYVGLKKRLLRRRKFEDRIDSHRP